MDSESYNSWGCVLDIEVIPVRTHTADVVNENFDPEGNQRQVLNVFRDEFQVNPARIRERTGIKRQRVNDALQDLRNAGWIEKRCRGLYRLVYDGEAHVRQEIVRREE